MTVKKAVIPAAGLGTRFLPATKAMPKEMMPILNKPTIQYIVEEAIASGIEDIIIVTGKGKRAIEDHFDHAFELEQLLADKGKSAALEEVLSSSTVPNIHYIRQKEPKGLGHAIWCARKFVGDEPFAVLLGDDIVVNPVPCLKQLIDEYTRVEASVLGVMQVPDEDTYKYGIMEPLEKNNRSYSALRFVEKPQPGTSPSNLAIIGRYVLTPDIFPLLDEHHIGIGGEIQLTDAIEKLNQTTPAYGYEFDGRRYDVGDILGFLDTNIEFALANSNYREKVIEMLQHKMDTIISQHR
ncbi:UTP--glucose-1-phosphate uridylyltransferase GalU [Paenibacillus sp. Marseille-Q4541]|uniref:UTP--glucose-1-phosphate uridylyltransferase GalU n=1 Tax=Paenibacillus sp. Marseille-Q4541 TaxID=2831522 RepID=UPI001BA85373|nr:UTP--glucose-1-phosphate uridylyltransferase GalU [Paenibacillus sp. Marseille-Q4541]